MSSIPAEIYLLLQKWRQDDKKMLKLRDGSTWGNLEIMLLSDDAWIAERRAIRLPELREIFLVTDEEVVELEQRKEILKTRMKKGIKMLYDLWGAAENAIGEERDKLLETWEKGREKLDRLCAELNLLGFEGCLFTDSEVGKQGVLCLACPKDSRDWKADTCPMWRYQ